MKLISILFGIHAFSYLSVKGIASPLRSSRTLEDDSLAFPKIFYTDVPVEDARNEEIVMFVAELDLTGQDFIDMILRLSYLIHDEDDYDHTLALNPFDDNMMVDVEETIKLHDHMVTPPIQNQSADTIAGFPCYRNLAGVFQLMDDLVSSSLTIDNLVVEKYDIGDSYEKTMNPNNGADIFALKITGEGLPDCHSTEKGIAFVTCGVHAREYSPPELCSRWAEALVNGYGNDPDITSILDHTEVHLIMESNPDGRAIAEVNQGVFWRKNTRPGCSFSSSRGVDLNRNFPFKWGYPGGSSGSPCSATYRGSSPASEPEVSAIINYAESVFPTSQRQNDPDGADLDVPFPEDTTIGVYLDIHAYSELILWPFAYEERYCGNEVGFNSFARKLKSYNNYALSGPFQPDFLYPASGVTDDYFYKELGAAGMTYELGTSFYQDCFTAENEIFPDNIPSLMYFAKVSTKPYSLVKGPDVIDLDFPAVVNALTDPDVTISITVSDDELSAGPGNYQTSTQNIDAIQISVDMHPYDVDLNNNGPTLIDLPVLSSSTTVTSSLTILLSNLIPLLASPLNGEHTIYAQGTDENGYTGPVTATSFVLQNVPSNIQDPIQCPICVEDPDKEIIGLLTDTRARFATCGQLAAASQFVIDLVCDLDPVLVATEYSPASACQETCVDPNSTPNPNTVTFGLTPGPQVIYATCELLSQQSNQLIGTACSLDMNEWSQYDASAVCCETCAS